MSGEKVELTKPDEKKVESTKLDDMKVAPPEPVAPAEDSVSSEDGENKKDDKKEPESSWYNDHLKPSAKKPGKGGGNAFVQANEAGEEQVKNISLAMAPLSYRAGKKVFDQLLDKAKRQLAPQPVDNKSTSRDEKDITAEGKTKEKEALLASPGASATPPASMLSDSPTPSGEASSPMEIEMSEIRSTEDHDKGTDKTEIGGPD